MLVIVTEAVPDRLRGYLSRWMLEVRAGVFIGSYSVRVRLMLEKVIRANVETGNVVIAWSVNNESGFDFETIGENRRIPATFDGLKLVSFFPQEEKTFSCTDAIQGSLKETGKGQKTHNGSVENSRTSNSLF